MASFNNTEMPSSSEKSPERLDVMQKDEMKISSERHLSPSAAQDDGQKLEVDKNAKASSTSALSDVKCFKAITRTMPCVGKGLYLSGIGGITNANILKSQKITHVLNLAQELKDVTCPKFVSVRFVALRDSEEEDLLRWLPDLVEHIRLVISGGGHIVVNCVAGVSRSASVCLAYKVCHEDMSLRQAYHEVLKVRSVIAPNPGFWGALIQWEMKVRGKSSVVMKPYICGMVPELESCEETATMRIRIGWMEELVIMWTFHLLLFLLQVISIVWV